MIEKKEQNSRYIKFVNGMVRKQTLEIIIGKRKKYSFYTVFKPAERIFGKYDALGFEYVTKHYFKKARSVFSSRFSRINKNDDLNELKKKYPMVDIMRLAQFMSMEDKFSLNKKSDIKVLEQIIRCVLSLPMYDIKESLEKLDSDISIIEYLKMQEGHEDILKMIEENKLKYKNDFK